MLEGVRVWLVFFVVGGDFSIFFNSVVQESQLPTALSEKMTKTQLSIFPVEHVCQLFNNGN